MCPLGTWNLFSPRHYYSNGYGYFEQDHWRKKYLLCKTSVIPHEDSWCLAAAEYTGHTAYTPAQTNSRSYNMSVIIGLMGRMSTNKPFACIRIAVYDKGLWSLGANFLTHPSLHAWTYAWLIFQLKLLKSATASVKNINISNIKGSLEEVSWDLKVHNFFCDLMRKLKFLRRLAAFQSYWNSN